MSTAPENDGPHMRRCSKCGRRFKSRAAADQHIASHHKGKATRVSAAREDDDESYADIAVNAEFKRLIGEELDPIERILVNER